MQTILFISNEKPDKYPIIDKHYEWYAIHEKMTFEQFSEIYQEKKPYAIYTYGNNNLWPYLKDIFEVRKRWIHLHSLPEELDIIHCVFSSIIKHKYDDDNPLLSVITTTYNSKEKIQRPWKTLRNQTYTNWEWVIWDDSEDNKTYENLLEMQKKDLRMRVYKAPKHSGIIGEMKRLASGVAYGSFIIELDHDDEIHPELFQWVIDASRKYEGANFFYCDSAQLYENSLNTHSYGDFFGYGYASHANVWSNMHNKWIVNTIVAPPNGITLRHLIGMPNHIRVWKTDFYDKIGKHNPRLSVSDDYELLVKSYIHGIWCHIRACGYYQYRNEDGNFTFIRNSLIQHNVKHIYNHYKAQLPQPVDNYKIEPVWKFDGDIYPTTHLTYDPYPHDFSIILIDPTLDRIHKVISIQKSIHIYIIGKCPELPPSWNLKITWWDLETNDINDKIRYAKKLLVTGKNVLLENELHKIYEISNEQQNNNSQLNIITPCCRSENLDIIVKSINFDLINKWYIIYDTSKYRTYTKKFEDNPKIEEHFCSNIGVVGHPQRNFGLNLIKDGFVYFLDDDNIIHPEFWNIVPTLNINNFYTFDQQRLYEGHVINGNTFKIGCIDTAQYIIPKKFINNLKFETNQYAADGVFIIRINEQYSKNHIYLPKIGSYYNYLENNHMVKLGNIDFLKSNTLWDKYNNYFLIYNELFKDDINKNINILDLGSETPWTSLFPNATVYNKDINNINFDLIVNKGNLDLFENSLYKLNKGGYYIITSINGSEYYNYRNKIKVLQDKYVYLEFELLSVPVFNNSYDNNTILIIKYNVINQKVLAYYFPQYHSIPENDFVFGENFTDWNLYTDRTSHQLTGFKQPIQPPEGLGFYDPTKIEVRKTQAELAKKYGIDGFIYYHYWLENKAVMYKVFDKILEDDEPNIPFCFCFANDSWNHKYGSKDGKFKSFHPDGTTYRQLYDNPIEHALFLSKMFNHRNYIRINNKPVLFVYKFNAEASAYIAVIISELKKYNIDDIYIVACASKWIIKNFKHNEVIIRTPDAYSPFIAHHITNINPQVTPEYFTKLPCVYGGAMGWNSRLRHPGFNVIVDYNPTDITKNTCKDLISMYYDKNSPQMYAMFAWNEWGEGAIIEPNSIYGEELGLAIQKGRYIADLLYYDSKYKHIIFEYGLDSKFINVTRNVHINCIDYNESLQKWCIYIPKDDSLRAKLLSDPLPGIVKIVKVTRNGITTILDYTQDLVVELN